MKIKKLLALALSLTVTGIVFTSCGDSSSSSSKADSSSAAETTTTTTTAAESSEAETEASSADASEADASSADASSADASEADASAADASSTEEKKEKIDRTGHNTFLMLADGTWTYCNMNDDANDRPLPEGGTTCEVSKDGTYTVDVNIADCCEWMNSAPNVKEPMEVGDPGFGITVLNVDIADLATKMGVSTKDNKAWDKYCEDNGIKAAKATLADKTAFAKTSGLNITDLTLSADGSEVYKYADDEITFADVEANGKIRIELYNAYGDTMNTAPQAIKDFAMDGEFEELSVTFTISGIK